ncbi:MAG: hypothetical protein A2428_18025 [Bdellovibrionales bacterium RIFOXYC1_FULL_54_43]|nr:MAG: hypothetical protein A2428_18025 [Bdellovibrionales bacterium RIFOXYC1_FULL_54_43]OFZ84108.1 MAG: hypothetical protein A2603_09765 [Bdellovibrionales bacterium RIFOXYD1_FULL_55_31]
MKRLIAILSTGLAIGFAVALANAQDTSNTGSSDATTQGTMTQDQAGTSGETTTPPSKEGTTSSDMSGKSGESSDMSSADTSKSAKQARSDRWRTAKSCTDESGVTHRKGTKSFKECVDAKRRQEQQMGGQTGSEMSPPATSPDQSGTDSPTSGDTAGQSGQTGQSDSTSSGY